jgi:hypothetical protein
MRRIRELIARVSTAHPGDNFFAGVDQTLKVDPDARRQYQAYERALSNLDPESWAVLQAKAVAHFMDHRPGQRKQGFFNQLNDALAYQFLVRRGYKPVRILREVGKTQPDIEYLDRGETRFCEVKTIGISDEVIARRAKMQVTSSSSYQKLSDGFLNKLESALDAADRQIKARGKGLIFLLVRFDDFTLDYYDQYRKQIATYLESHAADSIYVKIGLLGRKHIRKAAISGSSLAPNPSTERDAEPHSIKWAPRPKGQGG